MDATIPPKTYTHAAPHQLAFIGLGVMGYPMAAHLARAGHSVTVYNRTPAKAQAQIVLCCVGNDDDLRSVTLGEHGAFAGMEPGAVFAGDVAAASLTGAFTSGGNSYAYTLSPAGRKLLMTINSVTPLGSGAAAVPTLGEYASALLALLLAAMTVVAQRRNG